VAERIEQCRQAEAKGLALQEEIMHLKLVRVMLEKQSAEWGKEYSILKIKWLDKNMLAKKLTKENERLRAEMEIQESHISKIPLETVRLLSISVCSSCSDCACSHNHAYMWLGFFRACSLCFLGCA